MLKHLFGMFLSLMVALWMTGCGGGKPADPAKKEGAGTTEQKKEADHGHGNGNGHDHDHDHEQGEKGPNGGKLLEVGEHAAHLEIKHDLAAGKLEFFVLDKDLKPLSIGAPKLTVMSDDGPKDVVVKALDEAGGKASKFEATDDAFKKDPINGRVELSVDGQSHRVKLEAHHDH